MECPGNYLMQFFREINFTKIFVKMISPILVIDFNITFFSAQVTAKYFEQLSDEEIMKIYTVYEDDFKLFDYTFNFGNISLPTNHN